MPSRRRDLLAALVLLALSALLLHWQWRYRGYVKDDAFISLRYARNLVDGLGLVFNPGDRLEGYTNFLWILLAAPAFAFGADPLIWAKTAGCAFGQVGLLVTFLVGRRLGGGSDLYALAGAALFATSSSVVLWSQSGLEPTLMAALCSGGTALGWALFERQDRDSAGAARHAVAAGLLLAAAGLTRPDAHLFPLAAGVAFAFSAVRRRRVDRATWTLASVMLAVLAPYHAFRVLYFGDLFPNTMYVKASAGPEVWRRGLEFVGELVAFNANGAVLALLPLCLFARRGRAVRLWGVLLVAGFLLYMVKIGRDEMKWFRLFLPVYPLALALAADGLRQVVARLCERAPERARPALAAGGAALALALAAGGGVVSIRATAEKEEWHNAYLESSTRSFMELGAYVAERSGPGARIAFQDMGAAPFAGGNLVWIDTIGILNRTVGRLCREHRLNPFMKGERRGTEGGRAAVEAFERGVRDDVFAQDPEWLAFVAYVGKGDRKRFRQRLAAAVRDGEPDAALRPYVTGNGHAQGIPADPRFSAYTFERYWKRNDTYWLVLYRKSEG